MSYEIKALKWEGPGTDPDLGHIYTAKSLGTTYTIESYDDGAETWLHMDSVLPEVDYSSTSKCSSLEAAKEQAQEHHKAILLRHLVHVEELSK